MVLDLVQLDPAPAWAVVLDVAPVVGIQSVARPAAAYRAWVASIKLLAPIPCPAPAESAWGRLTRAARRSTWCPCSSIRAAPVRWCST